MDDGIARSNEECQICFEDLNCATWFLIHWLSVASFLETSDGHFIHLINLVGISLLLGHKRLAMIHDRSTLQPVSFHPPHCENIPLCSSGL